MAAANRGPYMPTCQVLAQLLQPAAALAPLANGPGSPHQRDHFVLPAELPITAGIAAISAEAFRACADDRADFALRIDDAQGVPSSLQHIDIARAIGRDRTRIDQR